MTLPKKQDAATVYDVVCDLDDTLGTVASCAEVLGRLIGYVDGENYSNRQKDADALQRVIRWVHDDLETASVASRKTFDVLHAMTSGAHPATGSRFPAVSPACRVQYARKYRPGVRRLQFGQGRHVGG